MGSNTTSGIMRNEILPSMSSHQLYNFGNNDIQFWDSDVSLQFDGQVNAHGTDGFCVESIAPDDADTSNPYQSLTNYQPGYLSKSCSFDNLAQPSMLLNKMVSVPQTEMGFTSTQNTAGKRPVKPISLPQTDLCELIGNQTSSGERKNKKRKKGIAIDEQRRSQNPSALKDVQEHKVPVRRSQKLSEKITALQQLVSPYGKTDTASVLQEASFYIRLLQEQIQNLIQTQSSLYSYGVQDHAPLLIIGERPVDLQSRGLSLVPISITQKLTEDRIDPPAFSKKAFLHRHS
ncbi:transcription factor bHLH112-like isoform X2 [Tripterygium wilfordii]|uniref:transcription factor bHLH112-like isoform X2 n=1 Tax=Tripterygium wilfordii TaxID=458696 RepID=UPI0018F83B8D|nr:transcription factor bHLH112-like isoform X2 [Tripterygium wilfordii]